MGFASFLKQFGKMVFGFGGGFVAILIGAGMLGRGNRLLGLLIFVIAIVLLLFGAYNKRSL